MDTSDNIHEMVRKRYGQIAQSGGSCCGPDASSVQVGSSGGCGCGAVDAETMARAIGYSSDDLADLPEGANLGLGCGNPTAIAALQPGQRVLDLGSGPGIDVVLAARRVGPEGHVIGVDMTPAMLARGWDAIARAGLTNAELRYGRIEQLPVDDASIDVVISNCVINLSPDKAAVFREVARVLRPGGRMAISDLALTAPLPPAMRESIAAYTGCIGGAILREDYLAAVTAAGLRIDRTDEHSYDVTPVLRALEGGPQLLAELGEDIDPAQAVVSLSIRATRPE